MFDSSSSLSVHCSERLLGGMIYMAEFKVNIGNPKDGKTFKKEFSGTEANSLIGKKIGDVIKGDVLGHAGYEFEITGGSDYCGFPMRKDLLGSSRKRILITKGIGMRNKRKGLRLRKNVAGNTVYEQTAQINLKVVKAGKDPLEPKEESAETTEEKKEK